MVRGSLGSGHTGGNEGATHFERPTRQMLMVFAFDSTLNSSHKIVCRLTDGLGCVKAPATI